MRSAAEIVRKSVLATVTRAWSGRPMTLGTISAATSAMIASTTIISTSVSPASGCSIEPGSRPRFGEERTCFGKSGIAANKSAFMKASLQPMRLGEQIIKIRMGAARPAVEAGGLWSLVGGTLALIQDGVGPTTVLVPTEQVRLLAVSLPLASARRRTEALPFAIEDQVAEPIETLHLALGAEVASRIYLAGIVRDAVMADWVVTLAAAGLERAAIVPDALLLPVPEEGWSVDLSEDRALVRSADGTGFAVPAAQFAALWKAGGGPLCTSFGLPLPEAISALPSEAPVAALDMLLRHPALDLRQGRYARVRRALPTVWRRAAIVAAAGVAAHGAIAAADTIALQNLADERRAETAALIKERAPFQPVGDDLVTAATALLPGGGGGMPDRLLPLLSRTSTALQPLASRIGIRSLAYNAADGRLDLDIEAADLATLQQVEAALRGGGLSPTRGSASTTGTGAEGRISITGAAGRIGA
jgi:general secretion pathway protein L